MMNAERWQKIKSLFDAAQEIEPEKRGEFLAATCAGDMKLRREVEKLIASLENANSFMENPAAAEVASMFEEKQTLMANHTTGNLDNGKFVAGTVLANRYRIIGLLGKGGMGEVFKAEDIKLNQTVALKFLPDKLERDKAALERFHAEVRTARQVAHTNVCRVFDIGEVENRHFLSMEFIDGDDLASLLRRIGRLPSDKAVEIARQLCFGLGAIHEAGILHRDLKPANVIIDGKGKARITDFGIAGLEEELKTGETRVGTPAYMSPEQITGKEISQKSDIYSLGLVLYEIFTGKQAFQADSMPELLQRQQTTTPTNPSEVLKDIDPIVEKTILQCLEKNPAERPKNALQVALMLPGGNPLEAAIAVGETPSPEMVAAAPKKGALKPAVALAFLLTVVLLFAGIVLFLGKARYHEWIPLEKSPEALAERADSILKKLGYANLPADTDYGFSRTFDYYEYAAEKSPNSWERMRTGQPAVIYFWHRTSPRYLEPLQSETVSPEDPPLDVAGMTKVLLDARGRLLEFQAVPPQVKDKTVKPDEFDWTNIFAEAGLDIRGFRQTESNWSPPFFADSIMSWEGLHVDHADVSVRIEAAAFEGKPVYFQIVAPWDKPARQTETALSDSQKFSNIVSILIYLSLLAAAGFLAYRNVRNGRADRRGALKVTIFLFLCSLASGLLAADHIPDLRREQLLIFETASQKLWYALILGMLYLALEPFVRRRWAELLISWNRLLAGDWRDPMVGRDVLIGGIFGLAMTAAIYSRPLLREWSGLELVPNPASEFVYLEGFRQLTAKFLEAINSGVDTAFFIMLFLVLLAVIFRSRWFAAIGFWTLCFLMYGTIFTNFNHWTGFLEPALVATIYTVSISRFGLLTMVSLSVFFALTFHNPLTANASSWYFGNTFFAALAIFALAIYGFYTSLAGQKVFETKFFKEIES
ncbi:MAG: serine/threonine protein kinase [Acidobacteriota bacterium]|nr:serine/threonine protein kinase [Acidobacteriota bacterium]